MLILLITSGTLFAGKKHIGVETGKQQPQQIRHCFYDISMTYTVHVYTAVYRILYIIALTCFMKCLLCIKYKIQTSCMLKWPPGWPCSCTVWHWPWVQLRDCKACWAVMRESINKGQSVSTGRSRCNCVLYCLKKREKRLFWKMWRVFIEKKWKGNNYSNWNLFFRTNILSENPWSIKLQWLADKLTGQMMNRKTSGTKAKSFACFCTPNFQAHFFPFLHVWQEQMWKIMGTPFVSWHGFPL